MVVGVVSSLFFICLITPHLYYTRHTQAYLLPLPTCASHTYIRHTDILALAFLLCVCMCVFLPSPPPSASVSHPQQRLLLLLLCALLPPLPRDYYTMNHLYRLTRHRQGHLLVVFPTLPSLPLCTPAFFPLPHTTKPSAKPLFLSPFSWRVRRNACIHGGALLCCDHLPAWLMTPLLPFFGWWNYMMEKFSPLGCTEMLCRVVWWSLLFSPSFPSASALWCLAWPPFSISFLLAHHNPHGGGHVMTIPIYI